MFICLQAIFIISLLLLPSSLTFSFDLSSFLTNDSFASLIEQYLGPNNEATDVILELWKSAHSENPKYIINAVNKSMAKLQNLGIVNGYRSTEKEITLGILNVTALNSTMNGKIDTQILNFVISKLNSSSYVTGVKAVGNDYNLGIIDLTKIPTAAYPTIDYYLDGHGNETIVSILPIFSNQSLLFIGPLKNVVNANLNMAQNEKLAVYKQWYDETLAALKQNNTNPTLADYRKAFFCFPGISPLNTSATNNNLTTSIVTCDQLNSTYVSTMQEANDLFNLIRTPEAAASFLKNNTDLTSLKSIVSNLRSRLGYLSTILSETSSSAAVNSQVELVRQLIMALPNDISNANSLTAFQSFMTKYFQWTPQDFTNLQSELLSQ